MPQRLNQKAVNSFNAGLVTEFSELKFPDNASVDELNCELNRDGSRQRRKGLTLEADGVASSFTSIESEILSTGDWYNAGAVSGLNLMVVQSGSTLHFYGITNTPYSANKTSYTFSLTPYQSGSNAVSNAKCYFTSIGGVLVVVNPNMDTVVLTLNYSTSTLSAQRITFKIRDFDYQSDQDTLVTSTAATGVTSARKYDTANCGWVETNGVAALSTYIGHASNYPPLTLPWYSGKNSSGNFSVSDFEHIYAGNTLIGNGHYILDFFNKDRSTVSGFTGIATETEEARFRTVASYAGRIWYAGLGRGKNSGKVLFSRTVTSLSSNNVTAATLGNCYQMNDPTAEDFSDMLETDGGVINIPEASDIKKIYAADQFLYVFADNGVWVVAGVRNGSSNTSAFVSSTFSISDFFVSKISSFGLLSVDSFVEADGTPFWWSKNGVHSISLDQSTGMPVEDNISMQTIQSFWNEIPVAAKTTVRNCYDKTNKKIYWLYKDIEDGGRNAYSKVLVLNIPLKAFYPWSIQSGNNEYLFDLHYVDAFTTESIDSPVTTIGGLPVTTSSGAAITATSYLSSNQASDNIIGMSYKVSDQKIRFNTFTDETFKDFGNDYESYCVAGYDFVGDMERRKTAPFVTVFCRSTEEGWTGDEDDGYSPIHPSGLTMKAIWDFKEDTKTPAQQCYRIKPSVSVDPTDLGNTQQDRAVVTTRLKVRGKGRSMRLRFDSETGKDFILLGYNVIQGVNNGV